MIAVTDRPDTVSDLLPEPSSWTEWRRDTPLDAATSALWNELSSGAEAWSATEASRPAERATQPWSRILLLAEAPRSQFDLLSGPLSALVHEVGPVISVALAGRRFHGQRGRAWRAVHGNLHLSVARPANLMVPRDAAALSMLPALAVTDALAAVMGPQVQPGIKWVNDVLVGGRKVAGVLTATHVRGGHIDLVIFGVGVNVACAPAVEPTPFVPGVGCLRECPGGARVTLREVLWEVVDCLETRIEALQRGGHSASALLADYRRASLVIGRRVRIWDECAVGGDVAAWPAPAAAGLVVDIEPDLCLRLHDRTERVESGRLAFEDACEAFGL